jgi:hypothetical protein
LWDNIGKVNASVGWFFVFVITSHFRFWNFWKLKNSQFLDFKKRIQNKITKSKIFRIKNKNFSSRFLKKFQKMCMFSEKNWRFKVGSLTSSFDSLLRTVILGQTAYLIFENCQSKGP